MKKNSSSDVSKNLTVLNDPFEARLQKRKVGRTPRRPGNEELKKMATKKQDQEKKLRGGKKYTDKSRKLSQN